MDDSPGNSFSSSDEANVQPSGKLSLSSFYELELTASKYCKISLSLSDSSAVPPPIPIGKRSSIWRYFKVDASDPK